MGRRSFTSQQSERYSLSPEQHHAPVSYSAVYPQAITEPSRQPRRPHPSSSTPASPALPTATMAHVYPPPMMGPPLGALPHHYGAPHHIYPSGPPMPPHMAYYPHRFVGMGPPRPSGMPVPLGQAPYTHPRHSIDVHPSTPPSNEDHRSRSSDDAQLTYRGHIKTSADAILLLAACDLPENASAMSPTVDVSPPPRRICRRLLETERGDLVRSGSVFVWDEKEAGMRRWTDGRCWSASRVSGCFLTYRELEVRKRSAHDPSGPRSNQYKIDGLIKQSFSMTTTSGRKLHIVSYYTKRDLREGRLRRVSEDPRFVGESGGEWGLQVDETEFPDPVAVTDQSADVGPVAAEGGPPTHQGDDALSRTDASSPRQEPMSKSPKFAMDTQADGAPFPNFARTLGRSDSSHKQFLPALSRTGSSMEARTYASGSDQRGLKRPHSRGTTDENAASTSPAHAQRPSLKRLRSSSAGELVGLRSGPRSPGTSRHVADDTAFPSTSGTSLLTESNMRCVQPQDSSDGQAQGVSPAQHEQDNAAGALLSLRSSFGGSMGSSLMGGSTLNSASGFSGTPLTTPDESSAGSGKDTPGEGGKAFRRQSASQRPSGPERTLSDRDALNKLSVRL